MLKNRLFGFAVALLLFVLPAWSAEGQGTARWWRGNTHCHSWWSDGDAPSETVAEIYKSKGYNFLVLSEHDRLADGQRWRPLKNSEEKAALEAYKQKYGKDNVLERPGPKNTIEVKLKTAAEFRSLFEEPGRFIFITGEEISDKFDKDPVHLVAVNIQKVIPQQHGSSLTDTIQRNVDAVLEHGRQINRPVLVHLNHPNWKWSTTVEDMLPLKTAKFFEVFNGGDDVQNYGDDLHPSTDRLWDILLAKRLGELNLDLMYGIASDDAHNYGRATSARPGRGWVMVRAAQLAPDAIVNAMNQGDYYCSTGVTLKDVRRAGTELAVEVAAEPGVNYTITFVGTRKGFDPAGKPQPEKPKLRLSKVYSDQIGRTFHEVKGTSASYRLQPDDLYVRAKITSDKPHPNPFARGDVEVAWTQPLVRPK